MKKILFVVAVVLATTFFTLFSWYVPTTLKEDDSFVNNINRIRSVDFSFSQTDSILVGWSRENITPNHPKSVVGYGVRDFDVVEDSIFVNCLRIKSEEREIVLLSFDLLLITPDLAEVVKQQFESLDVDLYLSSSHTHSSIGNYGDSWVAEKFLGEFDHELVNDLSQKTLKAYQRAVNNESKLNTLIYSNKKIDKCINRLLNENYVKEGIRQLKLETVTGKMTLSSCNIHPTMQKWRGGILSKDYTRIFSCNTDSTFGMFMSGTMGGIQAITFQNNDTAQITKYKGVIDRTPYMDYDTLKTSNLDFYSINLETPKLAPVLTKYFRMRNWLSSLILGDVETEFQIARIGEVLMISLPCELSSEYYPTLEKLALDRGYKLVLTGFNGSYVGYTTPSEHFDIRHSETRIMNWTGKYGGDYYNKLIEEIILNQPIILGS